MVAMVASASGYGTLRRFLSVPVGQHDVDDAGVVPSNSVAVSFRSIYESRYTGAVVFFVPARHRSYAEIDGVDPGPCGMIRFGGCHVIPVFRAGTRQGWAGQTVTTASRGYHGSLGPRKERAAAGLRLPTQITSRPCFLP
ncbi:hypothetical protein EVAR_37010_1 [Eumeta japonica]|uniref:Uncharacterized protein n=1 Tax=Eumeta variegata TaxID=151549 RepID=A0A4C1X335_EUMVA|nr:hypothetical protein EVAR_37010_1 [Eumeta japonica]